MKQNKTIFYLHLYKIIPFWCICKISFIKPPANKPIEHFCILSITKCFVSFMLMMSLIYTKDVSLLSVAVMRFDFVSSFPRLLNLFIIFR